MLSRTVKMAFWVVYDHLGTLLPAGILWLAAIFLPILSAAPLIGMAGSPAAIYTAIPVAIFSIGIVLPVVSVGLAHMTQVFIETRDGAFSDFVRGISRYGLRAVTLGLAGIFAAACLLSSAYFYATRLQGFLPWLGYALAGLAMWCLIFLALTALLVLPVLVRKNKNALEAAKISSLLVLDNPVFCTGLALYLLLTASLMCLLPPLAVFLGPVLIVPAVCGHEMLSRKYAAIRSEQAHDAADDRRPPVVCRGGKLIFNDAADDYLSRGLRDFLFPWKG